MSYQIMLVETLKEIHRRSLDRQKIKRIADTLGLDRKTVRKYLAALEHLSIPAPAAGLLDAAQAERYQQLINNINQRPQWNKRHELAPYEEEIRSYLHDKNNSVKPKTVYHILKHKHGLRTSYSGFKRFFGKRDWDLEKRKSIIRIEVPAGAETQVDYGEVGKFKDPISGKMVKVWAFCGVLSYSRLPFYQFVFRQTQASFIASHQSMVEFYGGVTERYVPDNLKSGVERPDLMDPQINKGYQDWADHQGTFIDPARVATATDKGKIERQVPTARELFRRLVHLYPDAPLEEINEHALRYCREENGMTKHGTTGIEPLVAFNEVERAKLKPLAAEPFCIPLWKPAKVHPDQFIQYQRKFYGLPLEYVGKMVWVRHVPEKSLIQITFNGATVRLYTVPTKTHWAYCPEDFPPVRREFMESNYSLYLLKRAEGISEPCRRLVESILGVKAFINCRRAQAVLSFVQEHQHEELMSRVLFEAHRQGARSVESLRRVYNDEREQLTFLGLAIPVSDEGQQMVRDATAYQ